jgi:hypothetical protein
MDKRPIFWSLAFFVAMFLLFVAVLGHQPKNTILIDATPAATTACVKAPPVCDANCVRLTVGRRLA